MRWLKRNRKKKGLSKEEFEKMFNLCMLMESQLEDEESKKKVRIATFKSMVDAEMGKGFFDKMLEEHPELKEKLPIFK